MTASVSLSTESVAHVDVAIGQEEASTAINKPSDQQNHALCCEEKLEEDLTDPMGASDPPSNTQPGDHGEPVPSSGFSEGKTSSAKLSERYEGNQAPHFPPSVERHPSAEDIIIPKG